MVSLHPVAIIITAKKTIQHIDLDPLAASSSLQYAPPEKIVVANPGLEMGWFVKPPSKLTADVPWPGLVCQAGHTSSRKIAEANSAKVTNRSWTTRMQVQEAIYAENTWTIDPVTVHRQIRSFALRDTQKRKDVD